VRGVERVLRQGGVLHFWTDVEEYFRSTVALIGHCTTLCGPLAEPEQPSEHDMDYRTHFERRMRQHAVPVYRCRFERP
jgi:tRNA (guanine-N7-)-methyltransferase